MYNKKLKVLGSPVYFRNATESLNELLAQSTWSSVHIICDENTAKHCLPRISISEAQTPIIIPAGEQYKTIDTCRDVWSALLNQRADRQSLVINIGGGVVTDLGGFCAATYMRSIAFVHVPTTVLCIADAAIGGKVGVDFLSFKNYIGAFSQPYAVCCDPAFLDTLPPRQVLSGFAEVIKHGIIHDTDLFAKLGQYHDLGDVDWPECLVASVLAKSHFVEQDEHENLMRQALNFGHTIGHGIESVSISDVSVPQNTMQGLVLHGEAVAAGMIMESYLSREYAGLSSAIHESIVELIKKYFDERHIRDIDVERCMEIVGRDKKFMRGKSRFALISDLGRPAVGIEVPPAKINEAFQYYMNL